MALWGRIIDGVLVSVGPLPTLARRLDTKEKVDPSDWLEACRFYDLETFDPFSLGLPTQQRVALEEDIDEALQRHQARAGLAAKVGELTDLAKDVNWDWIDAFGHPDLLAWAFVSGQSPNAGASWGAPTAAVAADRLRLGVSMCLVELIRVAQALNLTFEALAPSIESADVTPPADR